MPHWLVDSPGSGDGTRNADFWLGHLRAQGITDVEVCHLDEQDQWRDRVSKDDCLMAAGGDGTVNGAAEICIDTGAVLAVLPSGTANDFARNLNIPAEPEQVARLVADGPIQHIDVAVAGDRIFLNVAHIGLGTLPAREADSPTKKWLGKFSYVATLVRQIGEQRGFHAEIQTDKSAMKGRWLSVAVASGAFFGGGHEIPQASANDGQLNIIAVKPRPLPQLLFAFLMVRLNGETPRRTSTVVQVTSPVCQVLTPKSKPVTVDGDEAGTTPFEAVCKKGALRVIGREVVKAGRAV
ncbi:MAG: YegS/Rv2252/BmrU family lipid kinase [Gammaproteobacteria bacterium]|uniref:Putative lipid kinase BmrU n=1 Tax=Marinobacter litoralis TaxID=187981 RepID=A0A3M2RK15_9GAMM|nr:YegS/Rv2252/BmrU family lipid kinase [Marinobacter litoralis]MBR9869860.1 YegS/Rv2252/BmrU family lipid kinase [Gammaproteobacteria bacterium]RMJ05578.1 putative lipid kinase BmrU [Marinobacter litoralis]